MSKILYVLMLVSSVYTMHTPSLNDHIIIHSFNYNNTYIFWIVCCQYISNFIDDMRNAYNTIVNIRDLKVYYNCGIYYDRLVGEIDNNTNYPSIAKGVYLIYSKDEPKKNENEMKTKIEKYLTYVRESDMYVIPYDQDWSEVRMLTFMKDTPQEIRTDTSGNMCYEVEVKEQLFKIENVETTKDGLIIFSKEMFLSSILTILFFNKTYFDKDLDMFKDTNASSASLASRDIVITPLFRGYTINKNILTLDDLKNIVIIINEDISGVAQSKTSIDRLDELNRSFGYGPLDMSAEAYASIDYTSDLPLIVHNQYTDYPAIYDIKTLDEECNRIEDNKINDTKTLYEEGKTNKYDKLRKVVDDKIQQKEIKDYFANIDMIRPFNDRYIKTDNVSDNSETYIYKSSLDKIVHSSSKIHLLREFTLILSLDTLSELSTELLDFICNKELKEKDVEDMNRIIGTLHMSYKKQSNVETIAVGQEKEIQDLSQTSTTISFKPIHQLQKQITMTYADMYKDDTLQTTANVVIENVDAFLSKHMDGKLTNKNFISKDLVAAGIKKVRRATGFVYGIKDTSKSYSHSRSESDPEFNYG